MDEGSDDDSIGKRQKGSADRNPQQFMKDIGWVDSNSISTASKAPEGKKTAKPEFQKPKDDRPSATFNFNPTAEYFNPHSKIQYYDSGNKKPSRNVQENRATHFAHKK